MFLLSMNAWLINSYSLFQAVQLAGMSRDHFSVLSYKYPSLLLGILYAFTFKVAVKWIIAQIFKHRLVDAKQEN